MQKKIKKNIPRDIYFLIDSINVRYWNLGFDNNFKELNEKEKLSKLIDIINNDEDIRRLHTTNEFTFSYELQMGERTSFGGFGVNLYFDTQKGLTIYDWNDYEGKYKEFGATADTIKRFNDSFNAEKLRVALVSSTERDNFITRYANYRMKN